MKWKLKSEPEYGSTRVKTRFLYLPTLLRKEYRWLEKADIKQEYLAGFGWRDREYVN